MINNGLKWENRLLVLVHADIWFTSTESIIIGLCQKVVPLYISIFLHWLFMYRQRHGSC